MPLNLTSAGRPVLLSTGTSVQLERNSPLFDEDTIKGEFSYPVTVPALPNGPLYGFPERPDGASAPGAILPAELELDGLPILVGSQRIKSASASKYSINVQAGLSGANLSGRQLASFSYGGLHEVPRWVPIAPGSSVLMPGLTQHANDVVAQPVAFNYVFAPLRNEYLSDAQKVPGVTPDPLSYPQNTVNRWEVLPVPLLGMPAGGSFQYYIDMRVPGGVGVSEFKPLPPYCPFPKLRYVLQSVCEESGLVVDLDNLLPGELGDLVIAGNAQLVDRGDAEFLRFSLADVLPTCTVAELLAALRADLGIVVYVDPLTHLVRSCYLGEQVAPTAPYLDLSTRMAGTPEASIDEVAGVTLTYAVDGADELTKDVLSQQPGASLLLGPVATVADLPAKASILADNPQTGQVRLVQAANTYYACTVGASLDGVTVPLTWAVLVVALPSVPVLGGGDEQAQAMCYTALLPTRLRNDGLVTVPLPAISQLPFLADQPKAERSSALRLLFYNGLQLASDGASHYPQLSPVSVSGAYSLRLDGEQGTYAQLLSSWLPVKLSGVSYKQDLLLSALDLSRLNLTQPVRLDGVPFLIRKLSATAPLRKPATAELVRL
jgi:hypothetical protein